MPNMSELKLYYSKKAFIMFHLKIHSLSFQKQMICIVLKRQLVKMS